MALVGQVVVYIKADVAAVRKLLVAAGVEIGIGCAIVIKFNNLYGFEIVNVEIVDHHKLCAAIFKGCRIGEDGYVGVGRKTGRFYHLKLAV